MSCEYVIVQFAARQSMRCGIFFFQAEDGIRDLVRSRGLGDVYKRQLLPWFTAQPSRLPADDEPALVLPTYNSGEPSPSRLSLIHI